MLKTMIKWTLSLAMCALLVSAQKNTNTITLDGVETTVHFNDGDTFKVLNGDLARDRIRITGYNTLETIPVHQWLGASNEYLLEIAHRATDLAQGAQWNCTTNGKKDGYGRLLAQCDDLALALLSAGLAHVYSADGEDAHRSYINKQKSAQKKGLGMWKYGTPSFIITSLHSIEESQNEIYNRLISTEDGSSELRHHEEAYEICEYVCTADETSCMVYVPYPKRYGSNRPECLR